MHWDEKAGALCSNARYWHSSKFFVPFCAKHWREHERSCDPGAAQFNNPHYPCAEKFHKTPADCLSEKNRALDNAAERESYPGYVYIYVSSFDLRAQSVDVQNLEEDEVFFYKVGMTRRTPSVRVHEQTGAVFVSGTDRGERGRDYFAVDNAISAEAIVHAELCRDRYRRFDSAEGDFEDEWFLGTRREIVTAMKSAVEIVDARRFAH